MKVKQKNSGVVMLMTIFIVAILSAVVIGIMQISRSEIQLVKNQIFSAQALATAEAGLNNALAHIRTNDKWTTGFDNEKFDAGYYDVSVTGVLPNLTIISQGTTSQNFITRLEADVTVASFANDYIIRIDNLRVNE